MLRRGRGISETLPGSTTEPHRPRQLQCRPGALAHQRPSFPSVAIVGGDALGLRQIWAPLPRCAAFLRRRSVASPALGGTSVPASSSTTLPLRRPASTLARAATAVGDASKCSSDGGALAGPFIWSALAPSPTIALPLECTVGAVSFYSTPLKDGRGRDGGNR